MVLRGVIFFFSLFILVQNVHAQSVGPTANREAEQVNTAYLWRHAMGGAVIGPPTAQAQSVVVALDGGSINAYSASGRPLWTFAARGRISPYVTRSREGTSYVCRTNGIFIAVNRVGRELWRANIGGPLSGHVVVGWDGRVFVPAADKIFCYTASGNLLWSRTLENKISAGPRLDQGGGILLCLENGDVLRFDPFGDAVSRRLQSPPRILLSINRTVLALFANGDVQSFDLTAADNVLHILPKLPSPPLAGAGRGGNAAVVLSDGRVVLLSGADGKTLWTAESHIRVQQGRGYVTSGSGGVSPEGEAVVIYDERGIYILSAHGATAINGDGRRLWFSSLNNASGIPAYDDEGILYSGGTDWILYAWKQEDRTFPQKQTLYGPAPEGSYGTGHPAPSARAGFSEFAGDVQIKAELDNIRKEIQAGRVGNNELEWLSYLMEAATGGIKMGKPYSPPTIRVDLRIQALELLARIGSMETIPWLVRFFRKEQEPLVKAAAARAIGGIGVDPEGFAIEAFLAAVVEGEPRRNEQIFVSVAVATGALCRFSGPPLFGTGSRLLTLLGEPEQQPRVQRQARHELESLMF